MDSRVTTGLIVSLALSGLAAAQSSLFLPNGSASAEGPSNNTFPWGRNAGGIRLQTVYDSTHFTAQGITFPIRITGARWRANASTATWSGTTYNNVEVSCGTCANDYLAVSATWASNRGADYTQVLLGSVPFLPGTGNGLGVPGPNVVDVTFTTPFLYDPSLGDFMYEVFYAANSNTGGTTTACDVFTTGSLSSRVFNSTAPTAATGTIGLNHALVVELRYSPAAGLYAGFSATPTSGASPLNVTFTDQTFTSDPAGVQTWAWDLDGDSIVDSNAPSPSFTYSTCGTYDVSLTVTDTLHPSSTLTRSDYITADPQLLVNASFTSSSTGPLAYQFTDTSTGSPALWSWDFDGDAIPDSALQNPAWTYAAGGTYNVTLTASNACGSDSQTTALVVIANELCAGAIPIVPGTNGPYSNVGAATDFTWTCATGGRDVWFSYRLPCNASVELNTCSSAVPVFDTAITIFSGACGSLLQLACNDDAGAGCGSSTLLSRATAPGLTAGTTIYVAVGGFASASGVFSLDLIVTPAGSGSFATVSPGCGGTTLAATGNPNIGGSATFTMAPVQGLPFINLGLFALGVPICAGGCVLGATLDATFPGASLGGPIPCDPLLIGATVYTQGIDLGAPGGCAAGDPVVLTLSDTIRTIIG